MRNCGFLQFPVDTLGAYLDEQSDRISLLHHTAQDSEDPDEGNDDDNGLQANSVTSEEVEKAQGV